jgi:hypothetical protein
MLKNFRSISFILLPLLAVFPVLLNVQFSFYEQVGGALFMVPILTLVAYAKPSWMPMAINVLVVVSVSTVLGSVLTNQAL